MTDNLPNVQILLLTYGRTDKSIRTIQSTCKNLSYPKELLSWYVCDDGSPKKEFDVVVETIEGFGHKIIGSHNKRMRNLGDENSFHAGKGYNLGLGICYQKSDFVLVLENDWELDEPLDLVPYVKLLQQREDVGICSFRILSVGADVHTIGHDGRIYLKYQRTTQYAYSGNPYLRHARYTKRYGWFAEDRNPGLMELEQDDRYRLATENLIDIWRPLDISSWGAWKHIGDVKTWK
jgi:hypothetical protein